MRTTTTTYLVALSSVILLACGGGASDSQVPPSGDGDACDDPGQGRYFPLATGNQWTYKVTDRDTGVVTTKTQMVGALETLDGDKAGIEAFRLDTQKAGGNVTSWQEDTGDGVLRHREIDMAGGTQTEEVYDPYKLRIDEVAEHIASGASWTETYTERITDTATQQVHDNGKTEQWTVESEGESITVEAGTFCAMRLRKQSTGVSGSSDKTYWFARGVGKIREDDGARLEELSSYSVQ